MSLEIRTLCLALFCSLAVVGCKQKSKDEPEPAAAPSATAAPAETAAPTPPPAETIPPPMQPPTTPAAAAAPKGGGESLKTCCAALHKQADSAAGPDKSLYTSAATSCDSISKLVTAGTTKKAAALTALRASIKGGKLPPGCE